MAKARYRYIGIDSERRKDYLRIVENFKLLKSGPALVKDDWKSTVIQVEAESEVVFCKRFSHGSLISSIKNQVRRSKAVTSYRAAKRAKELGIPVPEHLAAIEKRVFGFLLESFLIARSVEGAVPLQRFIKEVFPRDEEDQDLVPKRAFISSLAEFVAQIHSKGFVHNDLKGTNIIVREAVKGYEFHVLDLDCVAFRKRVPMSRIVKNLVQLNNDCMYVAGEFDRLRFFIYYLKKAGLDLSRTERRSLAEEIVRLTQEKVDRWRREKDKLERKGKSKHLDESINLGR